MCVKGLAKGLFKKKNINKKIHKGLCDKWEIFAEKFDKGVSKVTDIAKKVMINSRERGEGWTKIEYGIKRYKSLCIK